MSEYNKVRRAQARMMPESQLREAVDRLLEQCGREDAYPAPSSPRSQMLATEEIYMIMRLRGQE